VQNFSPIRSFWVFHSNNVRCGLQITTLYHILLYSPHHTAQSPSICVVSLHHVSCKEYGLLLTKFLANIRLFSLLLFHRCCFIILPVNAVMSYCFVGYLAKMYQLRDYVALNDIKKIQVSNLWKGGYGIFQYIIVVFGNTNLLHLRMSDHKVVLAPFCVLNVLLPVRMCSILAGLFQGMQWLGCMLDIRISGEPSPVYSGRDVNLTTYLHLVPKLRMSWAVNPLLRMT
jgi:hypothetical protein